MGWKLVFLVVSGWDGASVTEVIDIGYYSTEERCLQEMTEQNVKQTRSRSRFTCVEVPR